jgi:hypothetical protein
MYPIAVPLFEESVRQLAHRIWERRMRTGEPGDAQGDWLEARRRLTEWSGSSNVTVLSPPLVTPPKG